MGYGVCPWIRKLIGIQRCVWGEGYPGLLGSYCMGKDAWSGRLTDHQLFVTFLITLL